MMKLFSEEWWDYYLSGRGGVAGQFNTSAVVFSETTVRNIICQVLSEMSDDIREKLNT